MAKIYNKGTIQLPGIILYHCLQNIYFEISKQFLSLTDYVIGIKKTQKNHNNNNKNVYL